MNSWCTSKISEDHNLINAKIKVLQSDHGGEWLIYVSRAIAYTWLLLELTANLKPWIQICEARAAFLKMWYGLECHQYGCISKLRGHNSF